MFHVLTRAAMLALLAPAALAAQVQNRPMTARVPNAPAPSASAPAEARAMYSELQRIAVRLQSAHTRAMEDRQLKSAEEAFMRDIQAAMLRVDGGLEQAATRVRAMQTEAQGAQQRGDRARLVALNQELARIQTRFLNAQKSVLSQPAMAQRARTLEQQLHARMVQVEPETDRLLARATELQNRLLRMAQPSSSSQQQSRPGPYRSRVP